MSNQSNTPVLLKKKALQFFADHKNYTERLFNIIQNRNPCSLRLIEWFVINYAKSNPVVYKVRGATFNVFKSYKNYLSSFSKDNFDPFKREKKGSDNSKTKFKIKHPVTGDSIDTTVCQLMFFMWIFNNDIHVYIQDNLSAIKKSMKEKANAEKPPKKTGVVKAKAAVVKPAVKKTVSGPVKKTGGKVTLKF